jgi:hypothetical protein
MMNSKVDNKYILKRVETSYISKEELIGLSILMMLSKDIFKTNKDVSDFVSQEINLNFLEYAIKSRTLMIARTARKISEFDDKDQKKLVSSIRNYCFNHMMLEEKDQINHIERERSKNNANKSMKKWISALSGKKK